MREVAAVFMASWQIGELRLLDFWVSVERSKVVSNWITRTERQ